MIFLEKDKIILSDIVYLYFIKHKYGIHNSKTSSFYNPFLGSNDKGKPKKQRIVCFFLH